MTALRSILRAILGLFVDDWRTSLAVLAWLAVAAVLGPMLGRAVVGIGLTAGLAAILIVSVAIAARRAAP